MFRLISVFLVFITCLFYFSCERDTSPTGSEGDHGNPDTMIVKKPNIYLYPETTQNILVRLHFPCGGKVTESIPEYHSGWEITVEPSGRIDNQFDYLYYEATTPNRYQYTSGWIVSGDTLQSFFQSNMSACGFNQNEVKDFTDYWIPLLDPDLVYIIYPQFKKEIDPIITLNFSIEPESILRLFYVIKEHSGNSVKLEEPVINEFERSGFTIAEWGVILK